jgi:tetratricopeptide (TPR) repeat protein
LKVNASAPAPLEFEIPVTPVEPEAAAEEIGVPSAAAHEPELSARPAAAPTEEVDLSDEWEAMVQAVSGPAKADEAPPQEVALQPETPSVPKSAETAPAVVQFEAEPKPEAEPQPEPEPVDVPLAEEESADELPIELVLEPTFQADEEEQVAPQQAAEELATAREEIELELTPQPAASNGNQAAIPKTADDFLSELNAELDAMEPPAPAEPAAPKAAATKELKEPVRAASKQPVQTAPPRTPVAAPVIAKAERAAPLAPAVAASIAPPEPSPESLNQLAEVFQEFRDELGEMPDEDEDLETHYNLGIAYREMGLLDEAIGEFQKVAQAVQRGKPFPYAMNCAAMLALSFMDKGEPKIASLWYERALKTPGLDQDAILALRYDLGLSLESAGEPVSALDHFRQVYAMNIDYRDVADRIAMLQKH